MGCGGGGDEGFCSPGDGGEVGGGEDGYPFGGVGGEGDVGLGEALECLRVWEGGQGLGA